MMSDKLKPCPFCGGKADYNWGSTSDIGGVSHQKGWVNCTNSNCDASIDVDSIDDNMSDKELIDKWNKRTDDRLQQENAEFREALKRLVGKGIDLLNIEDADDEEDAASIHANFNDEIIIAELLLDNN
ncbi:coil containing protein [Vibrio phage 1.181.O._10N.286.46.C9]|nr:coil containing protein [Vibrio phage 1.181.O._10N.286.46.C9]